MRQVAIVVLLAVGCSSTGPGDSTALDKGRYDYAMEFQDGAVRRQFAGDLIVSQSSASSLSYFWDVEGFSGGTLAADPDQNGAWGLSAFLGGGRTAVHVVSRSGSTYSCAVTTILAGTPVITGTCQLTFEGPDSVRTAP